MSCVCADGARWHRFRAGKSGDSVRLALRDDVLGNPVMTVAIGYGRNHGGGVWYNSVPVAYCPWCGERLEEVGNGQ